MDQLENKEKGQEQKCLDEIAWARTNAQGKAYQVKAILDVWDTIELEHPAPAENETDRVSLLGVLKDLVNDQLKYLDEIDCLTRRLSRRGDRG